MSDPQQIAKASPRQAPPKAERSYLPRPGSRRFFVMILLLLIAPYVAIQIPREIGRWQLAQAVLLRERGEKEPAYEKLAAAMGWFPQSAALLIQRAKWRLQDGQREAALNDADQAVELAKENVVSLQLRGELLLEAGEFSRAVDDFKQVEAFSHRSGRPPRAESLNQLAYAQALAEIDLDEAFRHANNALELDPTNPNILDTRGYILHLQGIDDEALVDLDQAVTGLDELLKGPTAGSQASGEGEPDSLQAIAQAARAVAVVHYHRALVLQALGRREEAEIELGLVRKLIGRKPDKTLF